MPCKIGHVYLLQRFPSRGYSLNGGAEIFMGCKGGGLFSSQGHVRFFDHIFAKKSFDLPLARLTTNQGGVRETQTVCLLEIASSPIPSFHSGFKLHIYSVSCGQTCVLAFYCHATTRVLMA